MPRRRRPPRSGAITELPPLRILGQIAALQSIYYATALVLMLFMTLAGGSSFSLELIFGWASLRGDTTRGWLISFLWLCSAGAVAVALVTLIGRSKLVPDFALTLHFVHLVIVYLYTGSLPRHSMWWATLMCSGAATVAGGVWGCRWRELRPIRFGGRSAEQASSSMENGDANDSRNDDDDDEDDDAGTPRGRGRGRGRDGPGEYEMVGMKSGEGR